MCPHLSLMVILSVRDLQDVLLFTALLRSCKLKHVASFMESMHIVFDLPVYLSSNFPALLFFLASLFFLLRHPKYGSFSSSIFTSRESLGLIWSRICSFFFIDVHDIHQDLLWHYILNELIFPCQLSSLSNIYNHILYST